MVLNHRVMNRVCADAHILLHHRVRGTTNIQFARRSFAYLLSFGNKPWESLARKLKDEGFQSTYLDRLTRKVSVEEQLETLEKEIIQETGSALRKSEDKVNWALLRLEVKAREINRATEESTRHQAIREFNTLRQEALVARRDLTIHREAAGMRIKNWERTERLYPIPPACSLDAREAPVAYREEVTCAVALQRYLVDLKLQR